MQHDSSAHHPSDDRRRTEMNKHIACGMHDDGLLTPQPVFSGSSAGGIQRTPFEIEPHARQPRTTSHPAVGCDGDGLGSEAGRDQFLWHRALYVADAAVAKQAGCDEPLVARRKVVVIWPEGDRERSSRARSERS